MATQENTCCTATCARVAQPAPDFSAMGVIDGQFKEVKLSSYRGQYVVLFFWPLDFTFVCPTEIVAFSDRMSDFADRKTQVLGVSVDSHFTHLAWQNVPREKGGLGKVNYPMVADQTHNISRSYGVLLEDKGLALRGLFLIDKAGLVRHMVVNDLPLGRSVDEAIRMVDALQYFETHGEVCPANWKPGAKTIKPDVEKSKEFFNEWAKA